MSVRTSSTVTSVLVWLCVSFLASGAIAQEGEASADSTASTSESSTDGESKDDAESESSDEEDEDGDDNKRKATDEAQAKRILEALNANSGGTMEDTLSDGAGGTSMEQAFEGQDFEGAAGITTGATDGQKDGISASGANAADKNDDGARINKLSSDKKDEGPTVSVSIEEIRLSGTGKIDAHSVRSVVSRRAMAFERCIERERKDAEELPETKTFTAEFQISNVGRVPTAEVTAGELSDGANVCCTRALKRFRFPRPKGGAVDIELKLRAEIARAEADTD